MGCFTTLQVLAIVMLLCSSPPTVHGTTEYYAIPTEYKCIHCPGEPCHTLNHYASNIPNYTWSDVVVRFLPGNHSLNQSFHVSNKRNLQFTSFHPAVSIHTGSVSIHCTGEGNFHFQHTLNVTIVGLLFCMFGSQASALMFDNAINFRIHGVIVQHRKEHSVHSIYIKKEFGKSLTLNSIT